MAGGWGGVRVINVTRTGTLASWLLNLLLSGDPLAVGDVSPS